MWAPDPEEGRVGAARSRVGADQLSSHARPLKWLEIPWPDSTASVPGILSHFNGRAWLDNGRSDPWIARLVRGLPPRAVHRVLRGHQVSRGGCPDFAGEQTSDAYQGFLEGAVASGERCAREIAQA